MPVIVVCRYCGTQDFVYSNSDGGELVAGDEEDGVIKGVYDEAIRIMKYDDGYYLAYSPGPDEDGKMDFYSIGEPINFCPSCGRRLNV